MPARTRAYSLWVHPTSPLLNWRQRLYRRTAQGYSGPLPLISKGLQGLVIHHSEVKAEPRPVGPDNQSSRLREVQADRGQQEAFVLMVARADDEVDRCWHLLI